MTKLVSVQTSVLIQVVRSQRSPVPTLCYTTLPLHGLYGDTWTSTPFAKSLCHLQLVLKRISKLIGKITLSLCSDKENPMHQMLAPRVILLCWVVYGLIESWNKQTAIYLPRWGPYVLCSAHYYRCKKPKATRKKCCHKASMHVSSRWMSDRFFGLSSSLISHHWWQFLTFIASLNSLGRSTPFSFWSL